jgi:hypothetical protein
MDEMTRRGILHGATGAGLLAFFAPGGAADAADGGEAEELKIARDSLLACGLTEDEADCCELARKLAGKFFKLPELQPMDKQEFASTIYGIEQHLLSRPTLRRYQEMQEKLSGKK